MSKHALSATAPLIGKRIVLTRAAAQAQDLLQRLAELGAEPITLPTIEMAPPSSWNALDEALANWADYDGIIFTSANGVEATFARAEQQHVRLTRSERQWTCAIGPATANALASRGWHADIVPKEFVAEEVVTALTSRPLRGRRILLPRAAVARDVIPRELAKLSAQVDVVEAYRTVVPEASRQRAKQLFPPRARAVDAVTFTSSSTAQNFAKLLGSDYCERLTDIVLASIGPVTTRTLMELGLKANIEARQFTTEGLVEALVTYFRGRST